MGVPVATSQLPPRSGIKFGEPTQDHLGDDVLLVHGGKRVGADCPGLGNPVGNAS